MNPHHHPLGTFEMQSIGVEMHCDHVWSQYSVQPHPFVSPTIILLLVIIVVSVVSITVSIVSVLVIIVTVIVMTEDV